MLIKKGKQLFQFSSSGDHALDRSLVGALSPSSGICGPGLVIFQQMRLHLRLALRPFATLADLADAMNITVPKLKKRIREMERRGDPLSADALLAESQEMAVCSSSDQELFQSFHQQGLCLICGHKVSVIEGRQAGWGEFFQCEFCGFSAHENADFQGMSKNAAARLKELKAQLGNAKRILGERKKRGEMYR